MQKLFSCRSYRDALELALAAENGKKRRGVGTLASALGVHPTFIAKVLKGGAEFSMEQALGFCRLQRFVADETDFFVTLVSRDRAGDQETRRYFDEKLNAQRASRENLGRRIKSDRSLTLEQEISYYDSWLPQAVHMHCQLDRKQTRASIAAALNVELDAVRAAVDKLLRLDLVRETAGGLRSVVDFIHTSKESPLLRRLHMNWRQKIASDLLVKAELPGMHFSAVAALSAAAEANIRQVLIKALEEVKTEVAAAPSEQLCVVALDCYPL